MYAPFSIAMKFVAGAALAPKLLVLGVLDPATLFFGLYMVVEPRTAPADPLLQPVYAAAVAFGAVFLPLFMPGPGVLVALLLTNLGAVLVRFALDTRAHRAAEVVRPRPAKGKPRSRRARMRPDPPPRPSWPEWSIARRASSGIMVAVVVGILAAAVYSPTSTPSVNTVLPPHFPGGRGAAPLRLRVAQGTSLPRRAPKTTLRSRAQRSSRCIVALGPSVILSYDASTGRPCSTIPSTP